MCKPKMNGGLGVCVLRLVKSNSFRKMEVLLNLCVQWSLEGILTTRYGVQVVNFFREGKVRKVQSAFPLVESSIPYIFQTYILI